MNPMYLERIRVGHGGKPAESIPLIGKVSDGRALFEAALKLRSDLILTDISLPTLDGIEAAKNLKKSGCTPRIVFLTVDDDPGSLVPVLPQELLDSSQSKKYLLICCPPSRKPSANTFSFPMPTTGTV